MIHSWDGTEWQVFVALPDEPRWPHIPFATTDGVPTLHARTEALAALGYAPLDPAHTWDWMETPLEGDPEGVVALVATTTVTPTDPDTRDT
jgi:hypothetical protein